MCDQCSPVDERSVTIELKNLNHKGPEKFIRAVGALEKALGYDSERQQKEISPFRAVRDLEAISKDRVERHLLRLYHMIEKKWLGLEKAKTDPFVLNGRIFINPSTGKPLTKGQWATIKKDILKVFDYIYAAEEERIATHALSMGKVLKGMSIADSLSAGYATIKDAVDDTMDKLTSPQWRNAVDFAQQHAGELIVDLKQKQYTKIHDTLQTAIKNRNSHNELRESLFDQFGSMNRDWRRIAETEIGNSQNNGQLLTELENAKPDETIFMEGISSVEACPFCRDRVNGTIVVLLDAPPSNGGDEVTVDGKTYTAIWPGKDNYGRRRADWWVSAGTQHPHTYSKDTEVFTDRGWKLFPDLVSTDKIMALNPETKEIDFVKYVRFVEHHQAKMIHLSGRNFDLKVTPEHRQLYLSRKTGQLKEDSIQNIIQKSDFSLPRAVGVWKGGSYIPVHSLSEETYARLWAWFLADGCV